MWRVVAGRGRGKWERNGAEYPCFTVPISPFSRRSSILRASSPQSSLCKKPPHSPTAKREFVPLTDPHGHGGECGCLRLRHGTVHGTALHVRSPCSPTVRTAQPCLRLAHGRSGHHIAFDTPAPPNTANFAGLGTFARHPIDRPPARVDTRHPNRRDIHAAGPLAQVIVPLLSAALGTRVRQGDRTSWAPAAKARGGGGLAQGLGI